MTKEQIVTDLEVIIQDFKKNNNGCYPLALSEAVAIIKEIAIIEKLPEAEIQTMPAKTFHDLANSKEKGGKQ